MVSGEKSSKSRPFLKKEAPQVVKGMGFKKRGGTVKANKGKSVNLVCPRKEMGGALEMPKPNFPRKA